MVGVLADNDVVVVVDNVVIADKVVKSFSISKSLFTTLESYQGALL